MEFEDLSSELQEKAKACKTPGELLSLAQEEGYELSDQELEAIAGGWCPIDCGKLDECPSLHKNKWRIDVDAPRR